MGLDVQAEAARLERLRHLDILDTPPEEPFDRITRLVTAILDAMASLTLVDADRQWFKSRQGLTDTQTPREQSFCAHIMLGTGPMVVHDAAADPRFADNPLVTGEPKIRFYVGIPLQLRDGTPLGALCGIDSVPRTVSDREVALLTDLADIAMEQLELRPVATQDGLTGLMRRMAFISAAERAFALARRNLAPLCCLMLDLDHFKRTNDQYGHACGDAVLVATSAAALRTVRRSDFIGRLGGEEFCIILPDTGLDGGLEVAERLRGEIAAMRVAIPDGELAVTGSIGVAALESRDGSVQQLIGRADEALYAAKAAGRNRVMAVRDDLRHAS